MAPTGGGIYVHVPFCRNKCLYCDFYSLPGQEGTMPLYARCLAEEYRSRLGELTFTPTTLYLGGGTPSMLPPEVLSPLMAELLQPPMTEVTLEANPDDITEERLKAWHGMGINRLSIGVQCLDSELLRRLGRRHDAARAVDAYRMARKWFPNISVDLIFGLPGQTLEGWRQTFLEALALEPEHVSVYSLMYEEGTPLTRLRDRGKLPETDEETSLAMHRLLVERAAEAGYEHYEISNFAKPGYRSRHNSSYWQGKPYLGLGPGAHSYDGMSTRRSNPADLRGYLSGNLIPEVERLDTDELREEMILTRLRTSEGLDVEEYGRRFGDDARRKLLRQARPWIENSTLGHDPVSGRLSLFPGGVMLSDAVILDLASF